MATPETEPIRIVVNGEARLVPGGLVLPELLKMLGVDPSRVAVERNRTIVRKADWNCTTICRGDELEVVQFVGGG
jgi:thiamine biosynthesis protein ThiS